VAFSARGAFELLSMSNLQSSAFKNRIRLIVVPHRYRLSRSLAYHGRDRLRLCASLPLPPSLDRVALITCLLCDSSQVFGVFKIIDSTSHGERWDTLQNLTVLPYYDPPSSSAASADLDRRRRHHPRGDSSWLNYRGLFGDLGDDNCRFPICSVSRL
jgi:hypothetical protein